MNVKNVLWHCDGTVDEQQQKKNRRIKSFKANFHMVGKSWDRI